MINPRGAHLADREVAALVFCQGIESLPQGGRHVWTKDIILSSFVHPCDDPPDGQSPSPEHVCAAARSEGVLTVTPPVRPKGATSGMGGFLLPVVPLSGEAEKRQHILSRVIAPSHMGLLQTPRWHVRENRV